MTLPFLTVGALRAAMEGLPDDAEVVITDSLNHSYDQGVVMAEQSRLIHWDHDCTDAPYPHRVGLDCPTGIALELHLTSADEASEAAP